MKKIKRLCEMLRLIKISLVSELEAGIGSGSDHPRTWHPSCGPLHHMIAEGKTYPVALVLIPGPGTNPLDYNLG